MSALKSLLRFRIFTSWASLFLKGAVVFLLLPIFSLSAQNSEVSLWLLFFSFVTLGMIFDFGFSPTLIRLLSYARADKETSQSLSGTEDRLIFSEVLFAVSRVYKWLPFFVVLSLTIFGSWALLIPISHTELGLVAWVSWGCVLASIGIALYGQMYAVYLQGIDRVGIFRRNEVFGFGLSILLSYLFFFFFEFDFLSVVFLSQLGPFINTLLHRREALRAGFGNEKGDYASSVTMKRVWADSWRMGIGSVSLAGAYQGVGIFLGQSLDPSSLGSFLIGHRLIQTVAVFSNIPFYAYIPRMAVAYRSGDEVELRREVHLRTKLTLALLVVGLATLNFFGVEALSLLSSDIPFPPPSMWALFSLLALADRFCGLIGQVNLISDQIVLHKINVITSVWIFIFLLSGVEFFGVNGAILAMIGPLLLINAPYSIYHLYQCQGRAMVAFFAVNLVKFLFLLGIFLTMDTALRYSSGS